MKRLYLPLFLLIIALLLAPTLAQDDSGLVITGTATVIDENTIQVGGLVVDVSAITGIAFEDGMVVTVSGNLEGGLVIAMSIVIEVSEPEATEEPKVTPEPDEPDDGDVDITIVIEGPVESIELHVITIYNFTIELPENDPRITVIQIGDRLRIKGHHRWHRHHLHDLQGTLVIVAIMFDFTDIDVILVDGQIWRDSITCAVVPPDWAYSLAVHWQSRCDIVIIPGVPVGCKVTGMGGIKCSGRRSGR